MHTYARCIGVVRDYTELAPIKVELSPNYNWGLCLPTDPDVIGRLELPIPRSCGTSTGMNILLSVLPFQCA
jgi:hypothetical protein